MHTPIVVELRMESRDELVALTRCNDPAIDFGQRYGIAMGTGSGRRVAGDEARAEKLKGASAWKLPNCLP